MINNNYKVNGIKKIGFHSKIIFEDKKDFFEFITNETKRQIDTFVRKEAPKDGHKIKIKIHKYPSIPLSATITKDRGLIGNLLQKVFSRDEFAITRVYSENKLVDTFRALVKQGNTDLSETINWLKAKN